jgi:ABC-2 type transport system permease protein
MPGEPETPRRPPGERGAPPPPRGDSLAAPARAGRRIWVLVRREYGSRIRSKGFWIATLVLPLFMAALIFLPTLVLTRARAEQRAVIVDETGALAGGVVERLAGGAGEPEVAGVRVRLAAEPPAADPGARAAQRADLDRRVLAGEIDAWIWASPAGLAADAVEYHAESVSNVLTQEVIRRALSAEVGAMRLAEAGYDPARVDELTRSIDLQTLRVSAAGSRAEAGEAGFILAWSLFFLLYMILMIWGQQVLSGVLEEKSSRIVEVVVAAARPVDLMLGKLLGIGLAGLTQLAIWLAFVAAATAPGLAAVLIAAPEGFEIPRLAPAVAVYYCLYFLLGFFFISTFYAAIGAAFNNLQEAQHLTAIPVAFVVAPIVVVLPVINAPDSTLAVVTSLFPPFTPLLMPVRLAVKMPPCWQIALSFVSTGLATLGMVWLAARVYRVGILMYGKKPTLPEIWRWVRYG